MDIVLVAKLMDEVCFDELDAGSILLERLNSHLAKDDKPFIGSMTGHQLVEHYKSLNYKSRLHIEKATIYDRVEWRGIQMQIDYLLSVRRMVDKNDVSVTSLFYLFCVVVMYLVTLLGLVFYYVLLASHKEESNSFIVSLIASIFENYLEGFIL